MVFDRNILRERDECWKLDEPADVEADPPDAEFDGFTVLNCN